MRLPGFSAEASLYQTSERYHVTGILGTPAATGLVLPQWPFGWGWGYASASGFLGAWEHTPVPFAYRRSTRPGMLSPPRSGF